MRWIAFDTALSGSVELLLRYAVLARLSAGAACLAARHERAGASERTVLFIAADTGRRCGGHRGAAAATRSPPASARALGSPVRPRGRHGAGTD
ncbi:hypothetical protein ACQ86F_00045 [Streptomyces venezuelae ATCC 10712]